MTTYMNIHSKQSIGANQWLKNLRNVLSGYVNQGLVTQIQFDKGQ